MEIRGSGEKHVKKEKEIRPQVGTGSDQIFMEAFGSHSDMDLILKITSAYLLWIVSVEQNHYYTVKIKNMTI